MLGFGTSFLLGALAAGALTGVAAIFAYRRLTSLERRARQAERLAELGTLTGGLAHEIKNPLSTVQLNLRLLEEDLPAHEPSFARVINRLHTVQRETSRLRDILDDFLRFAGKLELDHKPTDLNALLEELADFFAPQAQLNRVQVRLRESPQPVIANVDAKLIKQAVLNLMLNAVQAMAAPPFPAGGARGDSSEASPPAGGELILSTMLGAGADAGLALIDVIDTGSGIAPEALPEIFRAYYSTKRGGTGLGLAMTRRIIEEHDGKIDVRSELGKGTDFTLRLPR